MNSSHLKALEITTTTTTKSKKRKEEKEGEREQSRKIFKVFLLSLLFCCFPRLLLFIFVFFAFKVQWQA